MQEKEEITACFAAKLDAWQKKLQDGAMTKAESDNLAGELQDGDDIQACYEVLGEKQDLLTKYLKVQVLLAKKLIYFGDLNKAKDILGNCEIYSGKAASVLQLQLAEEIVSDMKADKAAESDCVVLCNTLLKGEFDAQVNDDEAATVKYLEMHWLLADKMNSLGRQDAALEVIEHAKPYSNVKGRASGLKVKLEQLKKQIVEGTVAFPPVEETIEEPPVIEETVATPTKSSPEKQEPVTTPTPPVNTGEPGATELPAGKKSNKTMLLAAAAVVVILLGGFFAFSGGNEPKEAAPAKAPVTAPVETKAKMVAVRFNVPQGTALMIDGNKYESDAQVSLAVGKHKLELQHPLLKFTYAQEINITEASATGDIEVIKNIEPGAALADSVKQANIAVINDILQQAFTNDTINLVPELYTTEAGKKGYLNDVYKALKKKDLKGAQINQARFGSLKLDNVDGGKIWFVKTAEPVELEGKTSAGKAFRFEVRTTLKITGSKLVLVSLDKFKGPLY